MENQNEKSPHRVFVHDVANKIIIVEAGAKKVLKLLSEANYDDNSDEIIRLTKVLNTTKDIISMLKDYRQLLIDSENNSTT